MNIRLEKATGKDFADIALLARKIWMKHYIEIISSEQIEYMLGKMYAEESLIEQVSKGHTFYLIKNGNETLGYISIASEKDGTCFLHKFYIDTREQNKGTGSSAFSLLLQEIKHCSRIRLGVNRANYKSINFYFKLGFRIEKLVNADIGNGYTMDDFIMLKSL